MDWWENRANMESKRMDKFARKIFFTSSFFFQEILAKELTSFWMKVIVQGKWI